MRFVMLDGSFLAHFFWFFYYFQNFRSFFSLIGICLLQNELFPLPLCRHVLKYILDRNINWYDLAFFDAHLFESLRKMGQEAVESSDYSLTFVVDLLPEEVKFSVWIKIFGMYYIYIL